MNRKELNEIKRRIKPERNNITHIYGCFVNSQKQIISEIDEPVSLLSEGENDQYMKLLRKALSGTLGKNLLDVSFATKQVLESEEHKLLAALRRSELLDPELRERFYRCIIHALDMGDRNYLILLAYDVYDVPEHSQDGTIRNGGDTFRYLLCCICPVNTDKSELHYVPDESRFHNSSSGLIVGQPELGFMYPSFDDRTANIYSTLFYTKDTSEIHREFIDSVFKAVAPMSAGHQKEAFHSAVSSSLENDCSFDVIRSVHEHLSELIEVHKESRDPEPLTITGEELTDVILKSGVAPEKANAFKADCKTQFGENAVFCPENLINKNRFEILTPTVKITVDPKFGHLIQTKTIDGKRYIVISAENGIEVNGIGVNINE